MTDSTSAFTPPEQGKTTIDDKMFFEPQRLSYESVNRIAKRIASAVADAVNGKFVVIARTSLLADFANLNATLTSLRQLELEYHDIAQRARAVAEPPAEEGVGADEPLRGFIKEDALQKAVVTGGLATVAAAAAAAGPAAPVIGAVLGAMALLKQDVEYHGEQTSVDPLAFELALGNDLLAQDADKVWIPDLTVLDIRTDEESLQSCLTTVQNAKSDAWSAISPIIATLTGLERELDQATRLKDQKQIDDLSSKIAAARRDLDPLALPLERADQKLVDLQNQWNQVDAVSSMSVLARMLRAEALHGLSPVYVHAAVVSSGGHHRISRNLLRMLFFGDGLSFSGAAIVRWAVLDPDGSLRQGGIFTEELMGRSRSVSEAR